MRSVGVLFAAVAALVVVSASARADTVVATADPAAEAPQVSGPQALDAALPPAVTAAPAEAEKAAPLAPPEPTLFADINLATQTMTVSDTNGQLYRWPISSARSGYVTPTGTFNVNWTSRMHYSKQYDLAPMPHAVFFHEGVAVHATNAIGNLGQPASHGCVRLHPKNARIFYNLVNDHGMQLTQVVVHGKPPYSPVVAERRQRRYAQQQPAFQPFGFFAYQQPTYQQQPRGRRVQKRRYGGGYNTW
jgi:lipoprotein-anchoring transpeptidase ErfK/SrfK